MPAGHTTLNPIEWPGSPLPEPTVRFFRLEHPPSSPALDSVCHITRSTCFMYLFSALSHRVPQGGAGFHSQLFPDAWGALGAPAREQGQTEPGPDHTWNVRMSSPGTELS